MAHPWSKKRISSASGGAFTLIELLVVIAIISLLLGILVPTLAAARRSAKLTVCLTQQKYIGMAWMMYLEDSRDWFPPARLNMQWFYGGKEPCIYQDLNTGGMPTLVPKYRLLNPYVDRARTNESDAEIFRCPADRPIGPDLTHGYSTYDYFGNCFMMNWHLLLQVDPLTMMAANPPMPVSIRDVKLPYSRVVMAGDCQWYYTINEAPFDANFHNRQNLMNIVFLDGHAATTPIVPGEAVTVDYCYPIWLP